MKKLNFILSCLIIFGITKAQTLQIPIYDSLNPEMELVESSIELDTIINSTSKRIFFLIPGDYTDIHKISLKTDGTPSKPRWLIYYNPSKPDDLSTHPVNMEKSDRAAFRRISIDGNYWRIVRLYGEGYRDQTRTEIINVRGSHNIVSSILAEFGCSGAGSINIHGDYNRIENSVIRNTMITEGRDNHGIVFSELSDFSQVIGCEIYNCAGDGIQIHPGDRHVGCVINNNDIYIDPDKYFETISEFPHENGIDLKDGGGPGPGNWVRITNNRLAWIGSTAGGTGGSAGAIDFSNDRGHKEYILFEGNVFYECPLPFTTATGSAGGSTNHITLVRNIFYNASVAAINPVTQTQYAQEFLFNTIVNMKEEGYWLDATITNSDIIGNLVINGKNIRLENGEEVTSDYNVLINSSATSIEGAHSLIIEQQDPSLFSDYNFSFERLTDSIILQIPKCRPEQATDFTYLTGNKYFGENTGIGIDDKLYSQDWCGALPPSHSDGFPEVAITNPVESDSMSGEIEIVLDVSDPDNDLKNVEIKIDSQTPTGLEEISPYTYRWNSSTVEDGLHNLKAWAIDSSGNITYSRQIFFFIDNVTDSAPVITLDSPKNGETLADQYTVSALASDEDDDLVGVQFFLSGEKLGNEVYVPPYEFIWYTTTVNDGEYEIKAIARDAAGRYTESDPATVTVDNSYPPLIAITSPTNNTEIEGSIPIHVETSDRDDNIVSVRFMADEVLIGESFDAPYNYDWDTKDFSNGEYMLTAIAKDADDNTTPSRGVFVTVANTLESTPQNYNDLVLVFPNPAQETLTILMSNMNVCYDFEIISLAGKVMLRGNNISKHSINIAGIPCGAYIINIYMMGTRVTKKMIKSMK